MLSENFSIVLRSTMILAGMGGFVIGFGLSIWRETGLITALFRGTLLCAACTFLARFVLIHLFRAYLDQLKIKKQQTEKATTSS